MAGVDPRLVVGAQATSTAWGVQARAAAKHAAPGGLRRQSGAAHLLRTPLASTYGRLDAAGIHPRLSPKPKTRWHAPAGINAAAFPVLGRLRTCQNCRRIRFAHILGYSGLNLALGDVDSNYQCVASQSHEARRPIVYLPRWPYTYSKAMGGRRRGGVTLTTKNPEPEMSIYLPSSAHPAIRFLGSNGFNCLRCQAECNRAAWWKTGSNFGLWQV